MEGFSPGLATDKAWGNILLLRNLLGGMFAMLMPAAAFLFVNSLYLMLRVSPAAGSFPRHLTAAEEREALEKCA